MSQVQRESRAGPSYPSEAGVRSGEERRHSTKSNEDEGKHTERDRSPYERSIVQGGVQWERVRSGVEVEGETRTRGNIPGRDRIRINRSCVRTGSDRWLELRRSSGGSEVERDRSPRRVRRARSARDEVEKHRS